MTAPRRIIDEPAVREDIRDVVRKVRAVHPSYDVAAGVDRFAEVLRAAPAVATESAGRGLATKLLVVVGLLGVGLSATYAIVDPHRAAPSPPSAATPAVVATATELRPSAADVLSVSVDALPSAASPPPSPTAHAKARDVATEREREVLHLVELQRIAASDPVRAITLAKAGHAEFPRGALFQEREVILVSALAQAGQSREAGERARAFVKAYPKSPAAPAMRAIADAP